MPSESAQMFHLLRGQALRPMRKPLVIMMSKRLLRFKGAMSELSEFTDGAYKPVVTDPQLHQSQKVKRVILCSGQVYYDVLEARKQREHEDEVAIVRLEQLYPFPVAENGQVVIRPMMYLALSYDHRIIDGQEAVHTLVAIRELLESPEQLLLDL